jgi:hypothetical protein
MTRAFHLPITLAYARGAYTVRLCIGRGKRHGNFVLDSGSSTLVVLPHAYDPNEDASHAPTSWAQEVRYGVGAWTGPVLEAEIHFDGLHDSVRLDGAQFSLVTAKAQDLRDADGLFGLAYSGLNTAHDVSEYLRQHGIDPPLTWPWPFDKEDEDLNDFATLLKEQPRVTPTPLLTALANAGRIENRFALLLRRALVHVENDDAGDALLAADPLNQGLMVLGGEAEVLDELLPRERLLYEGAFSDIQLVHDLYYNVQLIAVQVGNGPRIAAPALDPKYEHRAASNAILDTGCSFVILEGTLYDAVIAAFAQHDARLVALIERFQQTFAQQQQGIPNADVDALEWPDLHFVLLAPGGGETVLTCTQEHYWPRNAMRAGQAYFLIADQLKNWPNQTILGLPLFAERYCVFDRSLGEKGRVRVAKARGADAAWSS